MEVDWGMFGAKEVWQVQDAGLDAFDSLVHATVISNVAKEKNATVVIVADSSLVKSVLGRIAVALKAGSVRGVISFLN
jgi:electron transfer flavoprotein alpha subunit